MASFFEYIRDHLFVIILTLLIGGFVALAVSQRASTPKKEDVKISGVKNFGLTDRTHVAESVKYTQTPPVGGKHGPVWLACDGKVYEQPIPNESALHSLEHGSVWLTYKADIGQASISKLAEKVKSSNYTMMSPLPDQSGKIVLSAWDTQLSVDSADDERVDQFLKKYRSGPQTPEPGATCKGPAR